ncbi:MAG: rhomboid family intramembrane serine protease [Actinophytocola sp.]|nr:rhomboid family intramembrane serine protease [Actinophytocola sp.]
MSTQPVRPTAVAKRVDPAKRVLPAAPKAAVLVALGFTALLYLSELLDVVLPVQLDMAGISARELSGLDGVLWAPLLHGGWGHLVANTVPVVLFGFLVMAGGFAQWVAVTATIWLLSGLGVWLVGPSDGVTIGASGLAFGWLAFLLVRGLFSRSAGQLVLAAVLFVVYGGMFWGVLPTVGSTISWQGHLFGALAGVLAAWLTSRADRSIRSGRSAPGNLAA